MLINVQNGKITAIAENDAEANKLLTIANIKVPKTEITKDENISSMLDSEFRVKRKYKRGKYKTNKTKIHCPVCDAFVIKSTGLKTHMFLKHGILSKQSLKYKEGMTTFDDENLAKPLLKNPLND